MTLLDDPLHSDAMAQQKSNRWYCVEISFETQGGEWATGRTEPTASYGKACSQRAEYARTGFKTVIVEVPKPETKPKPGKTKIGSHD